MKSIFLLAALSAIIFFAACSKKNSPGKTKYVPTTYTINMVPLIQAKCSPCHLPTKGGRKASFEEYESSKKYGPEMLERIQLNPTDRGFMPFKHDKLPAEEIAVFKKWIDDGMLEK